MADQRRLYPLQVERMMELARSISFFQQLPHELRQRMLEATEVRRLAHEESVARLGERVDALVLVLDGTLVVASPDGRVASTLRAGDCFGINGLLSGAPSEANVLAFESAIVALLRQRAYQGILGALAGSPPFYVGAFLQALETPPPARSRRMVDTLALAFRTQRVFHLLPPDVKERVTRHFHLAAVSRGHVFYEQGEAPDFLYFVVDGSVSVHVHRHEMQPPQPPQQPVADLAARYGECSAVLVPVQSFGFDLQRPRRAATVISREPSTVARLNLAILRREIGALSGAIANVDAVRSAAQKPAQRSAAELNALEQAGGAFAFSRLHEEGLHRAICGALRWESFPAGAILYEQGAAADAAYLVIRGSVSLHARSDSSQLRSAPVASPSATLSSPLDTAGRLTPRSTRSDRRKLREGIARRKLSIVTRVDESAGADAEAAEAVSSAAASVARSTARRSSFAGAPPPSADAVSEVALQSSASGAHTLALEVPDVEAHFGVCAANAAAGTAFGEEALTAKTTRPHTALCRVETEVLVLSRADYRRVTREAKNRAIGDVEEIVRLALKRPVDRSASDLAFLARCLRDIPLFAAMSEDMRLFVLRAMSAETVAADTVIFEEGDPGRHVFVLLDGSISVFMNRPAGRVVAPPSALRARRLTMLEEARRLRELQSAAAEVLRVKRGSAAKAAPAGDEAKLARRSLDIALAEAAEGERGASEGGAEKREGAPRRGSLDATDVLRVQREELEAVYGQHVIVMDTPGDVFGEKSVVQGIARSATLVTREPTHLLTIDAEAFLRTQRQRRDYSIQQKDLCAFLGGVFPLSAIRQQLLLALAYELERRTFARGDVIFRQGEPSDSLFIVFFGSARYSRRVRLRRAASRAAATAAASPPTSPARAHTSLDGPTRAAKLGAMECAWRPQRAGERSVELVVPRVAPLPEALLVEELTLDVAELGVQEVCGLSAAFACCEGGAPATGAELQRWAERAPPHTNTCVASADTVGFFIHRASLLRLLDRKALAAARQAAHLRASVHDTSVDELLSRILAAGTRLGTDAELQRAAPRISAPALLAIEERHTASAPTLPGVATKRVSPGAQRVLTRSPTRVPHHLVM